MRGNAEQPRVRAPVTVDQDQIRLRAEAGERRQQDRALAERKQSRHVRETQLAPRHPALDLFELGEPVDDDAGHGLVGRGVEGQVSAGNGANSFEAVSEDHALAQPLLKAHRLARRQVPARAEPRFHRVEIVNQIGFVFRTAVPGGR